MSSEAYSCSSNNSMTFSNNFLSPPIISFPSPLPHNVNEPQESSQSIVTGNGSVDVLIANPGKSAEGN